MCPVCRARFRSSSECSRCGADLKILMHLQVRAWQLRQAARNAIVHADPARALEFSSLAEAICHTPAGKRLKDLSQYLVMSNDPISHQVQAPEDPTILT